MKRIKIPITQKDYLRIMKLLSKKNQTFYDNEDIPSIQKIKKYCYVSQNKWILQISTQEREILIWYLHKLEMQVITDKRLPRDINGNIIATPQNIKRLNEVCRLIDYIEEYV